MKNALLFVLFIVINSCSFLGRKPPASDSLEKQFDLSGEKIEKFQVVQGVQEKPVSEVKKSKVKKEVPKQETVPGVFIGPEVSDGIFVDKDASVDVELKTNLTKVFKGLVEYEVDYLGMSSSTMSIERKEDVKIDGKKAAYFYGTIKSGKFLSYLYELNNLTETFIDLQTNKPIKYAFVQRESSKESDLLELYDHVLNKAYVYQRNVKDGQEHFFEKDIELPFFYQDNFSSLIFLLGMNFNENQKFSYQLISKAKFYDFNVEVLKVDEEIEVLEGEKILTDVLKIEVLPREPAKDKKLFNIWISKGKKRYLVKAFAKLKIGKANLKLKKRPIDL
jgi:hypothetical protein